MKDRKLRDFLVMSWNLSRCFHQTVQTNVPPVRCVVSGLRDCCSKTIGSLRNWNMPELNLTFTGPCIANIFAEYNQQDAKFLNLFISLTCSTCFRRVFRPSSGA